MHSTILNSQSPNSPSPRPHTLRGACLFAAAALLLAPGLCAQTQTLAPQGGTLTLSAPLGRQRFVPAPVDPSRANGADFTPLRYRAELDPDACMLVAHAGVGDSFPVQEEGKPKAFDVLLKDGNDDRLVIECLYDKARRQLFLHRDGTNEFRYQNFRYTFFYPSVSVGPDGKATTDKATIVVQRIPLNSMFGATTDNGVRLYTMRFGGDGISALRETLRNAFPKDRVVLSDSVRETRLPEFEIRNVRLAEIGRTIEFLSDGQVRVEVVEKDADMPGNIWRIGRKNPAEAAASTKMRSVAAPRLFADEKKLKEFLNEASEMDEQRLRSAVESGGGGGSPRQTKIQPLTSQKVFVLIGNEDGVAGLESFIKAAEQRVAEDAAAKDARATASAPKMRAVLAPHLFANEERLRRFTEEVKLMTHVWKATTNDIRKEAGSEAEGFRVAEIEPRKEAKVFTLFGSEEAIAGMESLIKAAEQLAAEEDAKRDAAMQADMEAVRADQKRDAELHAAKERAKAEKREQ